MDTINREKKFITLLFLLSIALFFRLVKDYIGVIIFAIITAFFSSGIYKKIYEKTKKVWIATTGAWAMIALVVILPLVFVITTLVRQVGVFANDIEDVVAHNQNKEYLPQNMSEPFSTKNLTMDQQNIQTVLTKIENFAKEKNVKLDIQTVYEKGFGFVKTTLNNITTWIYSLTMNMVGWFTALLMYIIITTGILVHQDTLLSKFKKILPLDQRKTTLYLRKTSAMLEAMVKWTFIIAILQWVITGISFLIWGVPYVMFWTVIVVFFSLIPMLGAGIIAFPVGLILLLTGSVRQGIMILAINILITGNVDTILRPRLVKGDAKINSTLLILSIFGAMAIFGFMGVFYGPVLMIFILTSVDYYLEQVK